MNLSPAICKELTQSLGVVFYANASLETIDGNTMAVYFNGSDFVSLHPKDNECDYAYIRPIDSTVRQVDLGGCQPANYVKEFYRLVIVTKGSKTSNLVLLQKFIQTISPHNKITITSILTDSTALYRQEAGGNKKNIKVKGYNYYALEFSQETKISTCTPPIC